jgi:FKBP-type peptidyl-prolyl cis-trans isomerase 2
MTEKILIVLIIAVILVSGCTWAGVPQTACSPEHMVEEGDLVKVQYRGTVEGALFDEGEIEFISMSGDMIDGFDEAVLGMCLGEEKNVTIPPEKAYPYNPELVEVMPVELELEKTLTVPVETFNETFGEYPVAGKSYFDPDVHIFTLKVLEVAGGNVTMEKAAEINSSISGAEPWPIEVLNVTEDAILLRRVVNDGDTVRTYLGFKTVSVSGGELSLDLNSPLAGKTLDFYIKVLEVQKD